MSEDVSSSQRLIITHQRRRAAITASRRGYFTSLRSEADGTFRKAGGLKSNFDIENAPIFGRLSSWESDKVPSNPSQIVTYQMHLIGLGFEKADRSGSTSERFN